MMKHMIMTTMSITLTAMIATGCTTTANNQEPKGVAAFAGDPHLGEQVDKICFTQSINGFSDATQDTVILNKSVNNQYLIEVNGGCYNLENAQSIALDSTLSCLTKFDNLIVSESAFSMDDQTGIGPQRCSIKAIYKWDKSAKVSDEK